MELVNYQCAIEAYVSDANNLCISFDMHDVIDIDGKSVLIIQSENAERFVLGLSKLLEEIKNG